MQRLVRTFEEVLQGGGRVFMEDSMTEPLPSRQQSSLCTMVKKKMQKLDQDWLQNSSALFLFVLRQDVTPARSGGGVVDGVVKAAVFPRPPRSLK